MVSGARTRRQDYGGEGVELLLDRVSRARQRVVACVPAHEALDDGGEQRLLIGKTSVDCGFSGRGGLGDFVDARALEAVFKKNATGRIENSLLDLAGVFARRAAIAHRAPPSLTFFLNSVRFHRSFAFQRAPRSINRELGNLRP